MAVGASPAAGRAAGVECHPADGSAVRREVVVEFEWPPSPRAVLGSLPWTAGVVGVFGPLLLGSLLVAVLAGGGSRIGHFAHFFGFLFGCAVEATYVFSGHGDDEGRSIPRLVGR